MIAATLRSNFMWSLHFPKWTRWSSCSAPGRGADIYVLFSFRFGTSSICTCEPILGGFCTIMVSIMHMGFIMHIRDICNTFAFVRQIVFNNAIRICSNIAPYMLYCPIVCCPIIIVGVMICASGVASTSPFT